MEFTLHNIKQKNFKEITYASFIVKHHRIYFIRHSIVD